MPGDYRGRCRHCPGSGNRRLCCGVLVSVIAARLVGCCVLTVVVAGCARSLPASSRSEHQRSSTPPAARSAAAAARPSGTLHGLSPALSSLVTESRASREATTLTPSAALTAKPKAAGAYVPPMPAQAPAGAPIVVHAGPNWAEPSNTSLNLAVLAGGSVHVYRAAGLQAVGALFAATSTCAAGSLSSDAEGATYLQLSGDCQAIRRVPGGGAPATDLPYPDAVETQWAATDAGRRVELTTQIGPKFLSTLSWSSTYNSSTPARTSTAYELVDPRLDPTGRYVIVTRVGPNADSPLAHEQAETFLMRWGASFADARRIAAPDGVACTLEDGGWIDPAKLRARATPLDSVLGLIEACDGPAGATYRPLLVDADTGAALYRGGKIPDPTRATRSWKPTVSWAPDGAMLVDAQAAGEPSVQWYTVTGGHVVSVLPLKGCTSDSDQNTCVTAVAWTEPP